MTRVNTDRRDTAVQQAPAHRREPADEERKRFEDSFGDSPEKRPQDPQPVAQAWQMNGAMLRALSFSAEEDDGVSRTSSRFRVNVDSGGNPSSINASTWVDVQQTSGTAMQFRVVGGPWAGLELQASLSSGALALQLKAANRTQYDRLKQVKGKIEAHLSDAFGWPVNFELETD